MTTQASGKLEAAKQLEKIRQMNKKNHQLQRQQQEEEDKQKKNKEEAALRREENKKAAELANAQSIMEELSIANFSRSVREIMEGVQDMGTEEEPQDNDGERSPFKKCHGSSKTASRRSGGKHLVSPPTKQEPNPQVAIISQATTIPQAATRVTSFLDKFIYPHSQVILELAVTLKSNKAFEEFTQALMSLITNAQMVDPKFVINPLNPNSKEKNITSKGKILPNMTKLGIHIKISGNSNAFNKLKVWDKDGESGRQSCKANKKEEFKEPTLYFSMAILSEVEPKEIIERTIIPCKQVLPPVFFSIFSQPTSQVTNSIQENPLRHPQRPIASGEGNIRIPLHHLIGSCSGYLLIPYFLRSDVCSRC